MMRKGVDAKGNAKVRVGLLAGPGALSRKQLLLVGSLLILQGLDVITTMFGLRTGLQEGNAFAVQLMTNHGEFSAYLLKAVATATIIGSILLLHRRYARLWVGLQIVAFYMFAVVTFNLLNIVFLA